LHDVNLIESVADAGHPVPGDLTVPGPYVGIHRKVSFFVEIKLRVHSHDGIPIRSGIFNARNFILIEENFNSDRDVLATRNAFVLLRY